MNILQWGARREVNKKLLWRRNGWVCS